MSDDAQKSGSLFGGMVDFRVPLVWMLSGSAAVGWALISMYFSMNQLLRDVASMQSIIKDGNQQAAVFAGEMSLHKYRMDKIENRMDRIEAQSKAIEDKKR